MRFISEKTETAVPTKTKTHLSFFFLFFYCHHPLVLFYTITNYLHSCIVRIHNHKLYPPYTCRSILSFESPINLRFSANTLHEFISSSSWSLLWASAVSNLPLSPFYWSTLVLLYYVHSAVFSLIYSTVRNYQTSVWNSLKFIHVPATVF